MANKKANELPAVEVIAVPETSKVKKIEPLTHEFSHGDFNILKDKLNEVIKFINK
jgi:hypothetical protein